MTTHDDINLNKLVDFIATFKDKFSCGIPRLYSDGSGIVYNAGGGGYTKAEAFESIKELETIILNKKGG